MRHISYCHLVAQKVICQTAGSCLQWCCNSRLTLTLKQARWNAIKTPKPHWEHINLVHAGALRCCQCDKTTQMFPHCKALNAVPCNGFSLLWFVSCIIERFSSSSSLEPVLGHLVSLNECAAHCNLPRFVASRQNNWWYQLKSAYCLTTALAHFTALHGRKEQRMSSFTWSQTLTSQFSTNDVLRKVKLTINTLCP